MREEQTEVVVVGAGPVGLLTALLLADAGIHVRIIDREARTTSRSYACALHPRTLAILDRLGLAATLIEQGRQLRQVAFYDGPDRRAAISLARPGAPFPFLLILPQNALEDALEQRLRQKAGLAVAWNHRFDACRTEADTVVATVEKLGGTSLGYIVPHWETVVQDRFAIRAQFLVGADGFNSLVRQRLALDFTRLAGPEFFAAYEFLSDAPADDEVRVVLDDATTNVLWPLPGNRSRWTFQLVKSELAAEFPEKERRAVQLEQPAVDERIRHYVQKISRQRAPWFLAGIQKVTWCTDVVFEHRLAAQFGHDRCWLVGDAAHQTGPVGAQSMNVGFREAHALAARLGQILRHAAPPTLLQDHNRQWQDEWRRLLGLAGGLKPTSQTTDWLRLRLPRILSCLPASGDDLTPLAHQLALEI